MNQFKVWIENESFEDARLSYQLEDKTYCIELQVKKKAAEITYDEFAAWLAHFQKTNQIVSFWIEYNNLIQTIWYL